jgi:hypothetical protein
MQNNVYYQLAVKGSYTWEKEDPSQDLDDIETPPNKL